MSGLVPAGACCAVHPAEPATLTCYRCGSFACGQCAESHEGVEYCAACYAREFGGKSSGRAVASLLLAILGLNCCMPFLGIPALILGTQELAAIERGESPAKGRSLAKGAQILGWIEIALLVCAVLFGAFWLVTVGLR